MRSKRLALAATIGALTAWSCVYAPKAQQPLRYIVLDPADAEGTPSEQPCIVRRVRLGYFGRPPFIDTTQQLKTLRESAGTRLLRNADVALTASGPGPFCMLCGDFTDVYAGVVDSSGLAKLEGGPATQCRETGTPRVDMQSVCCAGYDGSGAPAE